MAAPPSWIYYRNHDSSDNVYYQLSEPEAYIRGIASLGWSAPSGKIFKEWNTNRDGSGTSYQVGDTPPATFILYAIWEDEPTHAVTISYQNSTIATMDETGVKTLLTGSTFCEDDIIIAYTADPTYSITKTLTNVTTSNDDSTVVAGNSFYMDLTPANNYVISTITVTMGGVDITDQVFKAGTGAKAVTANGTYNADDDNLRGYDSVVVNVPNSYSSSDEGKVVSSGALVAQTSDTVSTNGVVDTTLINSLTVNVSGTTPTGTKQISITSNGTTTEDVTNYATASITVAVPTSGSIVNSATMVLTSEMNSYNILNTMGFKLKYKKSWVMMMIVGDTAQTGGSSYSNNNYFLAHNGTTITSGSSNSWLQQKSGKVAPSTMAGLINNGTGSAGSWYTGAGSISSDGSFTFRPSTAGILHPSGSTAIVIEVPNAYSNGSVDLTLFGN